MEPEAIDFYTKCADKTNNPIGRKMFLSIAEGEKYHIACATAGQRGTYKTA
jgi:rubrerythrin